MTTTLAAPADDGRPDVDKWLKATTPEHPFYRWPADKAGLERLLKRLGPEGVEQMFRAREQSLALIAADPWRNGILLDHWHHADLLLGKTEPTPENWNRDLPDLERLVGKVVLPESLKASLPVSLLALLGGNRSAKSQYCAKTVMDDLVKFPETEIVCFAETFDASRKTQQAVLWEYLPPELKALNGKRDRRGIYYVSYDLKGGFGLNQLILPNRSKLTFRTYDQDIKDIEGWPVGNKRFRTAAFWLDESAPLRVVETVHRRADYYGAYVLWSFTPVNGITPAVREVVNETCEVLATLPSELLPDRVNVPKCPKGHMPYLQRSTRPGALVLYFHSILNPFGTRQGTFYDGVKRRCQGASPAIVMRIAYGYCVDTVSKKFPQFGAVHIIDESQLPEDGTNYQIVDPHTNRPFFSLWWRVAPGNPSTHYIWADWPNVEEFGEWAVPTDTAVSDGIRKGWDGDAGPAQRELGYGIVDFKKAFLAVERIPGCDPDKLKDPQAKKILREAIAALQAQGLKESEIADAVARMDLRLPVAMRFMDPRGGSAPMLEDVGGTTVLHLFDELNVDPRTKEVIAPSMVFHDARGPKEEMGLKIIDELLRYDLNKPLAPGFNAPRLYVSKRAAQVIWALSNYTGRGGESGACKDPVDVVRYGALLDLEYVKPGSRQYKKGGER